MKKVMYIFLLLMVFVLTACNTNDGQESTASNGGETRISAEGPKPSVKGVDDVDVVNTHGQIVGWDKMTGFYDHMQDGVASELRIVHYTTEGDPMVTDLKFEGETLEVKHDTTRDAYGDGEIRTNICGDLVEETNPTNISYIAIDCIGVPHGMDEILQITYNMSYQDRFEFELKYGVELENEINTLTNTVVNKSSSGTQEERRVNLPNNVMQEVYKRLVMANFLAEKELSATCEGEGAMNYHLKVYINGGERDFRWASCDQSNNGVSYSEIAQYIIGQSEKEHSEKSTVTIQGYVLEVKENELLIGEELNMVQYEGIKDEIKQTDLDAFTFDFTYLEGIDTEAFKKGDKIRATIKGSIVGSKPGRATVKEIKKFHSFKG